MEFKLRNIPGSNPCDLCKYAENCFNICRPRAKWWDVQIQKVRERLGVR